jgi:hypothetical protein
MFAGHPFLLQGRGITETEKPVAADETRKAREQGRDYPRTSNLKNGQVDLRMNEDHLSWEGPSGIRQTLKVCTGCAMFQYYVLSGHVPLWTKKRKARAEDLADTSVLD